MMVKNWLMLWQKKKLNINKIGLLLPQLVLITK